MNIAILGGSFDPPHLGHEEVAKRVKDLDFIDQVWLMPCFLHPFHKSLSHAKHRLNMTKFLESENIKVSDFEIKQGKVSFTIDTLNSLALTYPGHKFYWIISSSELKDFPKWKDWKEIIEKYGLIIFPRLEIKHVREEIKRILNTQEIPDNITITDSGYFQFQEVSSTEIREKIKKGLVIDDDLNSKVKDYIIENNLYG